MAWDLPPVIGVGIPTLIIAFIGYGGHLLVFKDILTKGQQIWFQICLTAVWLSYVFAIYTDPGSPTKNFQPIKGQWRKWCRKCEAYKPERTHHCKICRKCVLQMDHHCPWIANCVGHHNMPQFLRFLLCVDYTNVYAFYHLCRKAFALWEERNQPIYLISKVELTAVILLVPLSFFVLLTVGAMTIRWFYRIMFTGMTEIESWEHDRIESHLESRIFWNKIQKNYKLLYGKELKSITSWSSSHKVIQDSMGEDEIPPIFTIDDIIFPYNIDVFTNLFNAFGYPWMWPLLWAGPLGDGVHFQKTEFVDTEGTGEDELGSIPWPPDSGHDDKNQLSEKTQWEEGMPNGLRYRNVNRAEWTSSYGEKISDFGVDVEAEEGELIIIR